MMMMSTRSLAFALLLGVVAAVRKSSLAAVSGPVTIPKSNSSSVKNSSRHVSHAAPAAVAHAVPEVFPKLPAVSAIMGSAFQTLGGTLMKEADELQAKIHSLQQDDIHIVAKKKSELELKLKGQEEQNHKIAIANVKTSEEIATLNKQNEALKQRAKDLHDGNTKIQKELHGMQSSLGLAAKDFTEASGEGDEEKHQPKQTREVSAEAPEGGSSLVQEGQQQAARDSARSDEEAHEQMQQQQEAQGLDDQPAQGVDPPQGNWDEEDYSSDSDQDSSGQGYSVLATKMLEDGPDDGAAAVADTLAKAASDADSQGQQAALVQEESQAAAAVAATQVAAAAVESAHVHGAKGKRVKTGAANIIKTKAMLKPVGVGNKGAKHTNFRGAVKGTEHKTFLAQALSREVNELNKQVGQLGQLEKANDAKMETAFHNLFEAGKRRQKKLNKDSQELMNSQKRLTALHAKLSESVEHLESIHTKLEKQLQKVGDSLKRIEKLTQS